MSHVSMLLDVTCKYVTKCHM